MAILIDHFKAINKCIVCDSAHDFKYESPSHAEYIFCNKSNKIAIRYRHFFIAFFKDNRVYKCDYNFNLYYNEDMRFFKISSSSIIEKKPKEDCIEFVKLDGLCIEDFLLNNISDIEKLMIKIDNITLLG